MGRVGYRRSIYKSVLFTLGCVLSFGLLLLVAMWKPRWRMYLTHTTCPLTEADVILPGITGSVTTVPGIVARDVQSGNLQDIAASGSLHEFLLDLHGKHGPIVSFYFGPQLTISICTPELFKQHLKVFDRPFALFELFVPLIGKGSINYINGKEGKRRHAAYRRCFSDVNVTNFFDIFQKLSKEVVSTWERLPNQQHVDLRHHMLNFALRAVLHTAFGSYFERDDRIDALRKSNCFCWAEVESYLVGNKPEVGSARHQEFEKQKAIMYKIVQEAATYRRQNRRKAKDSNLERTLFVDVIEELDLTEDERLSDMVGILVGGLHTTAVALTWALYYLAANMDVQNKLYKEIKEQLGNEPLSRDNFASVCYLQQVMDETLRCATVGMLAARFQEQDSELGGHRIPARTPVIHALGVAMMNPKFYPNPTVFDPERFSPVNTASRPKLAFEPFGFAGQRKCPGYKLSQAESKVLLLTLIRRFEIDLVPGQVVGNSYGLVNWPDVDIWVTLSPRT